MPNYTTADYPSTQLSFNLGPALLEAYTARLASGIGVDWSDVLPSDKSAMPCERPLTTSNNADAEPTQQEIRTQSRTS
jgi:hypothetical protein